jgi:hypothetical protein
MNRDIFRNIVYRTKNEVIEDLGIHQDVRILIVDKSYTKVFGVKDTVRGFCYFGSKQDKKTGITLFYDYRLSKEGTIFIVAHEIWHFYEFVNGLGYNGERWANRYASHFLKLKGFNTNTFLLDSGFYENTTNLQ